MRLPQAHGQPDGDRVKGESPLLVRAPGLRTVEALRGLLTSATRL